MSSTILSGRTRHRATGRLNRGLLALGLESGAGVKGKQSRRSSPQQLALPRRSYGKTCITYLGRTTGGFVEAGSDSCGK